MGVQQEITVDTATLDKNIRVLRDELSRIEGKLNKMYEAVQALDRMWDGPANEAFRLQFDVDREKMEELCGTIKKILDCMSYARDKYNRCETEISGLVAALRI